jgi:hypothetical protein
MNGLTIFETEAVYELLTEIKAMRLQMQEMNCRAERKQKAIFDYRGINGTYRIQKGLGKRQQATHWIFYVLWPAPVWLTVLNRPHYLYQKQETHHLYNSQKQKCAEPGDRFYQKG